MNNFKTIMKTELYDSADSPDNPAKMIKEGESVEVLQINLGDRYQYCQVVYDGKKYFMRAAFLDSAGELFAANYKEAYEQAKEQEEKITDIKVGIPYRKNNKIHIVLETGYFDKKELEDNLKLKSLENIKAAAAHDILKYYGKNIDTTGYEEKLLEFVLSPFGLLEVGEFNYSTRPGKSIKIKFSIHDKYFDVFEDMSMEDFTLQNINTDFVTTNFRGNELEKIIKDLSKILDKFDKTNSKLTGSLQGINFRQLSAKSKRFLADFKKYTHENGIVLSKDLNNKFELGFDKKSGILKYVLFFDPVGRFLKIGMSYLCDIFDPDISRMIQDHKNILRSVNVDFGLNPIDFSKRYIRGLKYNIGKLPKLPRRDGGLSFNIGTLPKFQKGDGTSIVSVSDATDIDNITKDPRIRRELTLRLRESRDLIGDRFLIDLPDIIMNIGDLNLLYDLVLNKISLKSLVDFLIGSIGSNLSIPELGEIKLRGVLMSLSLPKLLDILFEFLKLPELSDFGGTICDKYLFGREEYASLIESLIDVENIGVYFIHYKKDGTLGGLIPDNYVGNVDSILESSGLNDCGKLVQAIAFSQIDYDKFYQEDMVAKIMCKILTEGLPDFGDINECFNIPSLSLPSLNLGSLKIDMFDFFGKLDPALLKPAIDLYFKNRFKFEPQNELRDRLLSIPSISFMLGDLQLTRDKLLRRVDGIDLDFEIKKLDLGFSFPSMGDINPSFDFTNFQFGNLDDIFGDAVDSAEESIRSGIERSLVISIKGILRRVLSGLNGDFPNLGFPDFGSLSIPDLFNASNGTNLDFAIDIALNRLKLSKDFKLANLCDEVFEVPDPNRQDVQNMFEEISEAAKPLEAIRILKGQVNEKDYDNLSSNLSEPVSSLLDASSFVDLFESLSDIADFEMLEELERAYDNEEVFASLCENSNISFISGKNLNDNYANIKDKIRENYNNISEEELDDIVEGLIDDTKDSMVEAIGAIKDNYNSVLPFDENPCSFMPPQSSIPAMNFVNDMVFDNIFDTIEKQYKGEAATMQDAFLVTTSSSEYIQMRNYPFDSALSQSIENSDGTFELEFDTLSNINPDAFPNDESSIFNKEFAYNYFGEGTILYKKVEDGEPPFDEISPSDVTISSENGEWNFTTTENSINNIYIKKQNPSLVPVPMFKRQFTDVPIRSIVSQQFGGLLGYQTFDNLNYIKIEHKTNLLQKDIELKTTYEYTKQFNFIVEQYDSRSEEFKPCAEEIEIKSLNNSVFDVEKIFKTHVEQVAKKSTDSEYKYNKFKSRFDSFNDKVASSGATVGFVSPEKDLISTLFYRMSHLTSEVLRHDKDGEKGSDLFEMANMLSFVVDNDTVNLLKLQDTKNAAKQEFNSNCSFAENDDSLESSSIKHLISTMIRVQIIEEIVKNAFCNSNAYDMEASDAFIAVVWAKLSTYLRSQKDAFYEKFQDKYQAAYNEEFLHSSFSFSNTVKEIYSDISENFSKIFRSSEEFLPKLTREFAYDTDIPSQDIRGYITGLQELYRNSEKFFVQRVYRSKMPHNKGKEIYSFEYEQLPPRLKRNYEPSLRLSYIMRIGEGYEMPSNFDEEYSKRELVLNEAVYKLKNSISHEYLASNRRTSEETLEIQDIYLLPLAETRVRVTANLGTKSSISRLIAVNTNSETSVYNFLMNIMRVDHLKQSIIELYKVILTSEKPEISLIFSETKDIIKRNIETLDQDPSAFESQDNELDMLALEQQAGISTTPDYSATAKKMALMTVPLILKGFAEQFDPNIKIASKIRQGASLAGFDIPPKTASLMALPMNLIPFAPGPPIGPLGLLYLASSYLEPKERKKLADLKRGDNLNLGANQDTGTFEGGTIEEQLEEASNLSAEARRQAQEKFNEILDMTNDFMEAAKKEIQYLYDKIDQIVEDYPDQATVVVDVPDISGEPIKDYFEYADSGNTFYADGFSRGSFGKDGNIEFACIAEYILNTVLGNMTTDREDLTTLFNELFAIFQLFFPAPKISDTPFSGGHYDALARYLGYCASFDPSDTGNTGFKINRFFQNSRFEDAKHVLDHMSRAQYIMENLCQYFMYEFFVAFDQEQDFLDNEYSNVSNNYNRNFESYRSDLQQEDYSLYRKYILPSDHEFESSDYHNFVNKSATRLERAKKITETDSSGNMIGDNLYGVVGIFGNPIEEFSGISMTNLFEELQTRYLQALKQ